MSVKIRPDGLYEIIHPPLSILDYGFDWTQEVGNETVLTSVWSISPSLTLSSQNISGNVTSVFVNGGDKGKIYTLTNTITTSTITTSRTMILVCQLKGNN